MYRAALPRSVDRFCARPSRELIPPPGGGKRARFFSSLSLSLQRGIGNEIRRPSVRKGPRTSSISANIQAFRCEGERSKFYDVWGGGGVSLRKGYGEVQGRASIVSGRAAIRMSLIRGEEGEARARANVDDTNRSTPPPPSSRLRVCIRVCEQRAINNTGRQPVLCLYAKHSQLGDICRDTIASVSKRQGLETCHRRF